MSKSQIAVFLPIFFSALVICAVVLCTCMYCRRPSFLGFGGGGVGVGGGGGGGGGAGGSDGSDYTSSSDSSTDVEKGGGRRQVIERTTERVSTYPGGYGRGSASPGADHIRVVDADEPNEAEIIDVVEAHPDDDKGRFLGIF